MPTAHEEMLRANRLLAQELQSKTAKRDGLLTELENLNLQHDDEMDQITKQLADATAECAGLNDEKDGLVTALDQKAFECEQ